ncbi:MAG: hypothetical protein PHQ42_02860 [Patescibacteria group bacterium]|nr:hypothetical protein [Patescibacteria group bacterium]
MHQEMMYWDGAFSPRGSTQLVSPKSRDIARRRRIYPPSWQGLSFFPLGLVPNDEDSELSELQLVIAAIAKK